MHGVLAEEVAMHLSQSKRFGERKSSVGVVLYRLHQTGNTAGQSLRMSKVVSLSVRQSGQVSSVRMCCLQSWFLVRSQS